MESLREETFQERYFSLTCAAGALGTIVGTCLVSVKISLFIRDKKRGPVYGILLWRYIVQIYLVDKDMQEKIILMASCFLHITTVLHRL